MATEQQHAQSGEDRDLIYVWWSKCNRENIIDDKLVKVALYTKGTTFYEPTSQ